MPLKKIHKKINSNSVILNWGFRENMKEYPWNVK